MAEHLRGPQNRGRGKRPEEWLSVTMERPSPNMGAVFFVSENRFERVRGGLDIWTEGWI